MAAFTWGDTDKDGGPEIYWAPVNYSPYPDVVRILVYEYPGDGSDNMGVADGLGGFVPNATTNIVVGAGLNIRPIKFVIADPDADGKDELIFADRRGTMHLGVLSVDNIPNLGGVLKNGLLNIMELVLLHMVHPVNMMWLLLEILFMLLIPVVKFTELNMQMALSKHQSTSKL